MISGLGCVIFDVDGVLFDSNRIKTAAFREVISTESNANIEAFISYHEAHGGVSRYAKFDWFYRDHLKRTDWKKFSKTAAENFADTVKNNLLTAPFVPGANELLEKLKSQKTPCFVVSGGAHDEVNWVLKERGISHYFHMILGSPNTKKQNLQIIKTEGLLQLPAVFLGDADSDMEAATAFGLRFIFVKNYSLWNAGLDICLKEQHTIINDLREL